ncbi:MAG: VOC family protein [Lachnospiraceae bacterium]|nr:VOC family protein [Lachnospiraceae bacterium]
MTTLKIHHIGYLVKKIEKAKQTFETLGYQVEQDTVRDDIRKVDICFLTKDGYRVELVSPFSEDSVVAGLLKKYKNAPYHICYEADDPEAAFRELTENGFAAIDTPTPAPALGGCNVVFLTSPVTGMIELKFR